MIEKLGNFKTTDGLLRITDPCYTKDTWCSGTIPECEVGTWSAFLLYVHKGDWGTRVSEILAIFGDVSVEDAQKFLDEKEWKMTSIDVGVDSGQCGIFQDSEYPEGETGDYGDKDSFYDTCCKLTLGNNQGGIVSIKGTGVVSSSGYGDGSYDCLITETNSIVSGIRVVFIEVDNLEKDEIYDEDEEEEEEV
jgi:hypothetical protein